MTLEVNGARAMEFAIGVLFQFDGDPPVTNLVRIMTGGYEDYPTHLLVRIDEDLDEAAADVLIARGAAMGLDVNETADP
ncbi:MAG TPA: hypothetical protein VMD75_09685 [Candidatus Binataceae bacterium]|jgi:hypothetical protein|nr:hypothetical protein [Candidatus Binataceae bacterium]